jgi:hypothetical protein
MIIIIVAVIKCMRYRYLQSRYCTIAPLEWTHRSITTLKYCNGQPVDHLPYTWSEEQWQKYTTARRSWSFDTV